MKNTLATLTTAGALIIGVNIGLHYGLTAKPVLDLNQCSEVIRYEDNSLECTTADRTYTQSSDDGDATAEPLTIEAQEYRPAAPMTGAELQPAATAEQLQPAKKYR